MASDSDCSIKQDWNDEVADAERWQPNDQCKVGRKYEHFRGNETHYGQAKEKLEEELTRLVSVMSENKNLLLGILTCMQETDDELKLVLKLIRADLEKSSNESVSSEEEKKKSETEQRIMTNLIELVEGQEIIKSKLNDHAHIKEVTKLVEKMAVTQQDTETKKPLRCYWCHEEGHMKRNCPQRVHKRWMQTQVFRQPIVFQPRRDVDDRNSMSWPIN